MEPEGKMTHSHAFCMMLDLQLSSYHPLCYNSTSHRSLLQCLRTTSAILAGAHSYFVVSSFKSEGKSSCHDLVPNPHIIFISQYQTLVFIEENCVYTLWDL